MASVSPPPPPPSARSQSSIRGHPSYYPADTVSSSRSCTVAPLGSADRHGYGCSAKGAENLATSEQFFAESKIGVRKTNHVSDIPADTDVSLCHDELLTWRSKWPENVEVEIPQNPSRISEASALSPISLPKFHTLLHVPTETKTPMSLRKAFNSNPAPVCGEGSVSTNDSNTHDAEDCKAGCNKGLVEEGLCIKGLSSLHLP